MIDEDELEKLLTLIISVDKTPKYEYRCGRDDRLNYLNADGVAPGIGCRWSTPAEICKEYLKDIEHGTPGVIR